MGFSTLPEIIQTFNTEEKCRDHLTKMRWPNDVICPHCYGYERINQLKSRPLWWCGDCKKQFSVKVGTIFEDSRIPLQKWFRAIWLLTSHKEGISSHQLAKDIGVTQKTAWFMLDRIREVMPKMDGGKGLFDMAKIGDTNIKNRKTSKHAPTNTSASIRRHQSP